MTKPEREAIDTLISITGLSQSDAIRLLEEHSGNLNEAVDAHFSEGDRNINRGAYVSAPREDDMEVDDPIPVNYRRPPSLLSPTFGRNLNPVSLLDPNFMRSIFDTGLDFANRSPFVSHPREVREIPIEVRDGLGGLGQSRSAPVIEEVTETTHGLGPEVRGTVIYEDEDDVDYTSNAPITRTVPSDDIPGDIEEEMIRAAIEASKQDAAVSNEYDGHLDLRTPTSRPGQSQVEDAEIAHALSLSLQTAEREKASKEIKGVEASESRNWDPAPSTREYSSSNGRSSLLEVGSSTIQEETEEAEEMPLVRNRRRRVTRASTNRREEVEVIPPSSPRQHDNLHNSQAAGSDLPSDEWGGISSAEHDEAVMLEAAMFGGIPEETRYHFPYTPHELMQQNGLVRGVGPWRVPRPPSPSLTTQRLIREQQDDAYLAALQADREKELKVKEEAEAALAEERRKEEETRRKLEEEQETEKQISAKEASLPQEPTPADENAVNLLVRMPDGSRRGRRFLKSDKLQFLFDFIDVGRGAKPGSYRLVRPYPRRAFSDGESTLTLNELGLTSKQEALYLELI